MSVTVETYMSTVDDVEHAVREAGLLRETREDLWTNAARC